MSVRLRGQERSVEAVARGLTRVRAVLDKEGSLVATGSQTPGALVIDTLSASNPDTLPSLDGHLIAQATAGDVTIWRDGDRMRMRYRPHLSALLTTSVLLGLAIWLGAAIWRSRGPFIVPAIARFDILGHGLLKCAIAPLLAYPLMRWRMQRLLKAAMRCSDARWAGYVSRWRLARRIAFSISWVGAAAYWLLPGLYKEFAFAWNALLLDDPAALDRGLIIEIAWLAASMLAIVGLMAMDWERSVRSLLDWIGLLSTQWRGIGSGPTRVARVLRWLRPLPVGIAAAVVLVLARGPIAYAAGRAADTVLTVYLESQTPMNAETEPRSIDLPGSSRVVLERGSWANVIRSIGRPQVNIGLSGIGHFDVGLDRDTLHLVGRLEAYLTKGSYTVLAPSDGYALDVTVQHGRATLLGAAGERVVLSDGQHYRMRRRAF